MKAHVIVTHLDGSTDLRALEGDRSTLGRSLHASIPVLGSTELEDEHLLLAPRREGCWVGVHPQATKPVLRDGVAIEDGMVPWDTVLAVGGLRITLRRGDARAANAAARGGPPSRVPVLVLAIAVSCGALALAQRARGTSDAALEVEPSALFDVASQCELTGARALDRGRADAAQAAARGERFFFDFRDGVEAVQLYDRASACLRSGGNEELAETVDRERAALASRIDGMYARLRVRLALSIREGDDPRSLATIAQLRELTSHRHDDYTTALAALDRELSVAIGELE